MILVPGDSHLRDQNVPSGTCFDENCGLFSSLSLDGAKLNEFQSDFVEKSKQQTAAGGSTDRVFANHVGPSAFALVSHGYVLVFV